MKRYKQTVFPRLNNLWDTKSVAEIAVLADNYYKEHLENTSVVNLHTGIKINFVRSGIKHLLNFGKGGNFKYQLVKILPQVLRNAEFKNFKPADEDDGDNIVGYMNFGAGITKHNSIENFRIVIRITNDGKFYYHHGLMQKRKKA